MGIMRLLSKLIRNKDGSAAIEMAFVMPVIIMAGLGVADLGLYIQDPTAIAKVIKDSANRGTEVVPLFGNGAVSASVVRSCGCPENETTASCTVMCGDGSVPSIYFDLNAQSTFRGIFIIPNKTINSSMRVKTR